MDLGGSAFKPKSKGAVVPIPLMPFEKIKESKRRAKRFSWMMLRLYWNLSTFNESSNAVAVIRPSRTKMNYIIKVFYVAALILKVYSSKDLNIVTTGYAV